MRQIGNRKFQPKRYKAEAKKILDSARWEKLSQWWLDCHPLCVACGGLADMVHHIKSRETHPHLAFDLDNLASMDRKCHGKLTAQERYDNGRQAV